MRPSVAPVPSDHPKLPQRSLPEVGISSVPDCRISLRERRRTTIGRGSYSTSKDSYRWSTLRTLDEGGGRRCSGSSNCIVHRRVLSLQDRPILRHVNPDRSQESRRKLGCLCVCAPRLCQGKYSYMSRMPSSHRGNSLVTGDVYYRNCIKLLYLSLADCTNL